MRNNKKAIYNQIFLSNKNDQNPINLMTVKERIVKNGELELRFDNGQVINLRRFAPVGVGDLIEYRSKHYWVYLRNSNDKIRITPAWKWRTKLSTFDNLPVIVKEIETEEELEGYKRLTEFHYRGSKGVGRNVPLIAITECWELPKVIGFIELSSSFIVNTARNLILDAPFSDPERGIAWTKWDHKTSKKYGNTIARISRCVVFPELRGVGLATILTTAVTKFAKERWHIAGLKPLFIEITAEMLRYWPFVESCGFFFAGETQGNQHRAAKDMKYLIGRTLKSSMLPKGGGGIMSQQRSHATMLAEVIDKKDLSLNQILNLLKCSPEKLTDDEWVKLHKVFRRPKPTYISGLTTSAIKFLERRHRIGGIRPNVGLAQRNQNTEPILKLAKFSLYVTSKPKATNRARRVQEAFGIVATEFNSTLTDNLNMDVKPSETILVIGPSGSGKSLLLRSIRWLAGSGRSRGRLPKGVHASGERLTKRIEIAWPQQISADISPIELLQHLSLEESLQILAFAGLAEAQLFVRPSRTLSLGQSYRLSLALALSKKPALLMIDEFCEPLDRFTTVAVSRKLRRATAELGIGLIAATAYPDKVINTLMPDKILLLSSSGYTEWIDSINNLK